MEKNNSESATAQIKRSPALNAGQRLGIPSLMISEVDFDFLDENPKVPVHYRGQSF